MLTMYKIRGGSDLTFSAFKTIENHILKCRAIGLSPVPTRDDLISLINRLCQIGLICYVFSKFQSCEIDPIIRLCCGPSEIESALSGCEFWNRLTLKGVL